MSIRHLSYVACDCCGDPEEAVGEAREARALAKRRGWTRRRGHDICPRCSAPDHEVCSYGTVWSPGLAGG